MPPVRRADLQSPGTRRLAWLALAMSGVAGFVDAVGFLTLDHLYTANMSGNTVALGFRAAERNGAEAFRRGWPVAMFVCGLIASAAILEAAERRKLRSKYSLTLGLETVLLVVFVISAAPFFHNGEVRPGSEALFYFFVALPAIAMGLQNATLTRVGSLTVHTTHVTGALTSFADDASKYVFWFYDRTRGRLRRRIGKVLRTSVRQQQFRRAVFYGGLWVAFVAGAAAGGYLKDRWALAALGPACVFVGVLAMIDFARPMPDSDRR